MQLRINARTLPREREIRLKIKRPWLWSKFTMALKLCDQSFETGEKKERRSDINRDMVVYIYIRFLSTADN